MVINLWIGFAVARIKPFPVKLRFLLRERRYLGVVSGVYLLIHFTMYLLKEGLEWEAVEAIVEKRYLFCGAVSLGIISLLLITSTDFAVKLLKFKNWKSLHRLIHVAFVFILVHVFSIEKADLIKYAFILIPLFLAQTLRFSFSFAKNRKVPFQPPHS